MGGESRQTEIRHTEIRTSRRKGLNRLHGDREDLIRMIKSLRSSLFRRERVADTGFRVLTGASRYGPFPL